MEKPAEKSGALRGSSGRQLRLFWESARWYTSACTFASPLSHFLAATCSQYRCENYVKRKEIRSFSFLSFRRRRRRRPAIFVFIGGRLLSRRDLHSNFRITKSSQLSLRQLVFTRRYSFSPIPRRLLPSLVRIRCDSIDKYYNLEFIFRRC